MRRDINAAFRARRPPPERYMRKKDPEAVSKVIDLAFRKFGLADDINRYKFVLKWAEIMGDDIAKRSRPEYIKGKTLVVRAQDSTWSQELSFHKKTIITRLNSFLGQEAVDDVMFVVR